MLKYLEDIEKSSTFALAFGKELRANEKEEIFETLINNNKTVQKRAVNSDNELSF